MPPSAADPLPWPIPPARPDPGPPCDAGPLPGEWPLDLLPEAFAPHSPWPWRAPWLTATQRRGDLAVGDAVRVVAVPELFLRLPRRLRRRHGKIAGELFEILAFTLPGELAIGRVIESGREREGLQVFFLPVHCVERVYPAAPAAPSLEEIP
jgi:hypothetical protein